MSDLKTTRNNSDVEAFLNSIEHEKRREDSLAVLDLMRELTGEPAEMWGPSIVGFGSYHYKYASGREGDWMKIGFSPRKQNLTLYIMDGFDEYDALLGKLGKHSTAKSCLYIKQLEDINIEILKKLIEKSFAHVKDYDASK